MVMASKKQENVVLDVRNISVNYGNIRALNGISLKVNEGEFLGIIGHNGGGKTTLLKAILGLVKISSGTISIFGKEPGQTGTMLGYVPQVTALDKSFPANVQEVVMMGRLKPRVTPFHRYSSSDRSATDEMLNKVGIYNIRKRLISTLSGGEFQRILIARALVVEPKMLLLDEPTASVDLEAREQIYQLLQELNKTMTVILVTHDVLGITPYAGTVACLNGRLHYYATDKELSMN